MNLCCKAPSASKYEKKMGCPQCDVKQNLTSYQTLLHHLRNPYTKNLKEDVAYYFCSNSNCNIVYFDTEDNVFLRDDLRQKVGQKTISTSRQICYCFDVTYDQITNELAQNGKSKTKEFVIEQTKIKNCACDIRNPSGKCCLADFPSYSSTKS